MLQNAEPPQAVSTVPAPIPAPTGLSPSTPGLGRWEKITAAVLFLCLLVLRIMYAQNFRVDSDEPQHLHVVWGWANGMLQYKDVFDNHSPLFQMLCAPLFGLFRERADIIIPMRHAMLPLFAFDLWCIYKIGTKIGTKSVALWSTLAAGFAPVFLLVSTEFRTDDLWVALWFFALVLVTGGPFKGWRAFWTGLVFGAAFAVSMKSVLLLVSLVLAALFVFVLCQRFREPFHHKDWLEGIGLALLGMAVIPGALVAFFASKGALHEMYYGVIEHNTVLGGNKIHKLAFKRFLFPIALIAASYIGYWIIRLRADRSAAYRQSLIFLCALFYAAALKSFWPLLTDQDYLPLDPLIVLSFAPAVAWLARLRPPWTYSATGFVLLGLIISLFAEGYPWQNDAADKIQEIAEVLRLTNPGDYVMDGKGEFIYRKRPWFYVLEGVTISRMRLGLIADDIPKALIEKRACVLVKGRMKADEDWIEANYLFDTQKVGVAGKDLDFVAFMAKHLEGPQAMTFPIAIPANYTVLAENGQPVSGTLDGKPLQRTQFLDTGEHRLELTGAPRHLAVVWTQAVDRGFSVHWRSH